MRLLHTADWHLGHTLYDHDRQAEHEHFLRWLQDSLGEHGVDALVIAGDVFHTANPPVKATSAWFSFLASTRSRYPDLDIVVVGGNHDSATRLDAPNPILAELGVHVIGGLPFRSGRAIDTRRVVLPLTRDGEVRAWIAALPYLRVSDLPPVGDHEDAVREGLRVLHAQVFESLRRRAQPGQALLATGHLGLEGARYSQDSERRVVASERPLNDQVFPPDLAYVALGHLHLAQSVSGRENVRYCGSPIPLSMTERDYPHQVLLVDLDGEDFVSATPLPVPRLVDMLRVPQDFQPLAQVLQLLQALPDRQIQDVPERLPFLEVRVLLTAPRPGLRQAVEKALEGKRARLVRINIQSQGSGLALADVHPEALRELNPEQVFRRRYDQAHQSEPPEDLLAAFRELVGDLP